MPMGKHCTQGTHSDVVHTDTSTRREVGVSGRCMCLKECPSSQRHTEWPYLSLKLKSGRLSDSPAFARRPPILYPHFHTSFTHSEKAVLVLSMLLCQNPETKQWETGNVFSHCLCVALPTRWTSCWMLTW